MKHKFYVFAIALMVSQVVSARVEGEFGGDYYQGASGSTVWGDEAEAVPVSAPAVVPVAPVAVQEAPVALQAAPVALQGTTAAQAAYMAPKSSQLVYAPAQGESMSTLTASSQPQEKSTIRLTPMVGAGDYVGRWSINTKNNISFGLATEFQTSSFVALELEGGYSNYSLAYTSLAEPSMGYLAPRLMAHNFDQFSLGGNLKVYLSQGTFRPYVGGGLFGVYYSGMQQRMPGDYIRQYNELLGSAQAIAGADVSIAKSTAIGIRGSWMVPVIDRPMTRDAGMNAAPGFEEAGLMNASYYKLMGTVSVDL